MFTFIIRRLIWFIPLLIGVTLVSYLIITLAPGDAVDSMINPGMSPADRLAQKHALGLDRPFYIQYFAWLGQLFRGNLGYSFLTFQPVSERIAERILPTVGLMGAALLLAYVIAIPIGVLSATRQYSLIDYSGTVLAFAGVSLPSFFLGLGGIYLFGLKLGWLPTGGMRSLGSGGGIGDLLAHLVLPAVVLSLVNMGSLVRYTRSSMLDVIRQDYVRTARSKGLTEKVVIYRHALRNALIPVITLIGLQLPQLLGGAVITEQVFGWPGMGRLTIEAIGQRDYPLLMGLTLLTAILVLVGNLIADVLYAVVDPRVRLGK